MSRADRFRARMVRGLARALEDEEAHLRKYRRLGQACGVLGAMVLTWSLFAAWGGSDAAGLWFVALGAVGGLLIGLALFFNSSVEQWPVNREFLDADAIRDAARRLEL